MLVQPQNLADAVLRWRLSWCTCDRWKIDTIECLSCCGLAASLKSFSISEYSDIGTSSCVATGPLHATERSPCSIWSDLIHIEVHNNLIIPNSAQLQNGWRNYKNCIQRSNLKVSMTFYEIQWDSMYLMTMMTMSLHVWFFRHVCQLLEPCMGVSFTCEGELGLGSVSVLICGIYRRCEDVSKHFWHTCSANSNPFILSYRYKHCRMHLLSRSTVFFIFFPNIFMIHDIPFDTGLICLQGCFSRLWLLEIHNS